MDALTAWNRPDGRNCRTLPTASQSRHISICAAVPTTTSWSSTPIQARTSCCNDRRSIATSAPREVRPTRGNVACWDVRRGSGELRPQQVGHEAASIDAAARRRGRPRARARGLARPPGRPEQERGQHRERVVDEQVGADAAGSGQLLGDLLETQAQGLAAPQAGGGRGPVEDGGERVEVRWVTAQTRYVLVPQPRALVSASAATVLVRAEQCQRTPSQNTATLGTPGVGAGEHEVWA